MDDIDSPPLLPPPRRQPTKRRRLRASPRLIGGVAIALVLAIGGWLWLAGDDDTPVADLRTGDCFRGSEAALAQTEGTVTGVSCDEEGDDVLTVLFELDLVGDTYPGDRAFLTQRCGALGGTAYSPSRQSWDGGDRQLTCVSRR
ncbi:MAG: hypothetical protein DHS20C19_15710 [Acidimicrobiales bacterium]|nr:MAG: hypothetical protein DHS20C19_15710 [Acidimicrobiales bacterium]